MTEQRSGGGPADVVYVLALMQAAFVFLGAVGELVLMGGNPAYLVLPVAKMVLLVVLAAKLVSGRRWAAIALIVVQGVTLTAFGLQLGIGLTPWVDTSVTMTGLITNVAMPAVIIYLAARAMPLKRRPPAPWPAPVTSLPMPATPLPMPVTSPYMPVPPTAWVGVARYPATQPAAHPAPYQPAAQPAAHPAPYQPAQPAAHPALPGPLPGTKPLATAPLTSGGEVIWP